MMIWKMMLLLNWVIFRFHVNLPGCNYLHLHFELLNKFRQLFILNEDIKELEYDTRNTLFCDLRFEDAWKN